MEQAIVPFDGQEIRKIWYEEDWYFSVVDVIAFLTNNPHPSRYWQDLKRKSHKTEGQVYDFVVKLKMAGADGKMYPTDCANTEGVFRIIQSVPSPKAEPFKMWLANLGKKAVDEADNPELGFEHLTALYQAKGYSDEWIRNRLQSIRTRKELTDEWKKRGVKEGQEYSLLTAAIAKGTFGLTPNEHSKVKGLDKQNLRDHMSPLELIFTALGEELTRMETVSTDAQGFNENLDAAQEGGRVAGVARRKVEKEKNIKIVTADNYLKKLPETKSID
jgi:hypothetical protein